MGVSSNGRTGVFEAPNGGSIPSTPSSLYIRPWVCMFVLSEAQRDVAKSGKARVWGTRNRWFESDHPDKSL